MSLVDLNAISGALATKYEDELTSQINRSVPLLNIMKAKRAWSKDLTWTVRLNTTIAPSSAPIGDGADVSVFNNDTKREAKLVYTTYHDAFKVSGRAVAGARASGNPAELEDLFVDELGDSVERLTAALGEDIYIGSGASNEMTGLVTTNGALMDTGTYAGIDRSDNALAQWKGNVLANSGTARPLTRPLMRSMRKTIYEKSGFKPDLIVTSPAQFANYGELFGEQRRYLTEIRLAGLGKITLDAGFEALEFDGIPVIEDQFCPDDMMLFLNTRFVDICHLPDGPNEFNGAKGMVDLQGTPEEQLGMARVPLQARLQPLAVQGDAMPYALFCYPQVRCKRPNACGVIDDLAV